MIELGYTLTDAQIFLTRKCNVNCGYCALVKDVEELGLEGWIRAYKVLENIGIKTVKLLGGEPTVKSWLFDLFDAIKDSPIRTGLLSNSTFDNEDEMVEKIANSGIYGYFASVNDFEEPRSQAGYRVLKKLQEKNRLSLLAVNMVISPDNIMSVPDTIKFLSDEGFWINLCMFQYTKQDKEFTPKNKVWNLARVGIDVVEWLMRELRALKEKGYKISVSEDYINGLRRYGTASNWQCGEIVQLRIDVDGGLMLCPEWRTKLADNYNILSLTEENYQEFRQQWHVVRWEQSCDGCYWSSILQAEDNLRHDRKEFDYVRKGLAP